jgi:hypothetical protein
MIAHGNFHEDADGRDGHDHASKTVKSENLDIRIKLTNFYINVRLFTNSQNDKPKYFYLFFDFSRKKSNEIGYFKRQ